MTLDGVTFHGRPPAILVSLQRPDGGKIRLASVPVRGPRPDESAPYRRFYDSPERVPLTDDPAIADALDPLLRRALSGACPSPNDLTDTLPAALFGSPAADRSGAIEPLDGDYQVEVQAVVADAKDEIAPMQVTLGGTVYGLMGTDGLGRDLGKGSSTASPWRCSSRR